MTAKATCQLYLCVHQHIRESQTKHKSRQTRRTNSEDLSGIRVELLTDFFADSSGLPPIYQFTAYQDPISTPNAAFDETIDNPAILGIRCMLALHEQ